MTLDAFRAVLRDPDLEVRAAYVGKLMRLAKPDDMFEFVRLDDMIALWPRLERSSVGGERRGSLCWVGGRRPGVATSRLSSGQVAIVPSTLRSPEPSSVSVRRSGRLAEVGVCRRPTMRSFEGCSRGRRGWRAC